MFHDRVVSRLSAFSVSTFSLSLYRSSSCEIELFGCPPPGTKTVHVGSNCGNACGHFKFITFCTCFLRLCLDFKDILSAQGNAILELTSYFLIVFAACTSAAAVGIRLTNQSFGELRIFRTHHPIIPGISRHRTFLYSGAIYMLLFF
jgi:hypothetical protein